MNEIKYYGYGIIVSKNDEKAIDLKNAKSYKILRKQFVDSITIEVVKSYTMPRNELKKMVEEIEDHRESVVLNPADPSKDLIQMFGPQKKRDVCIVVPTLETLGGSRFSVQRIAIEIITKAHLLILDHPELSTVDFNGNVSDLLTSERFDALTLLMDRLRNTKLCFKGKNPLVVDEKFKKVFWDWQNYYITTEEALELTGYARATFYELCKEYMMGKHWRDDYTTESSGQPEDWDKKPVRGMQIDEKTRTLLIKIQRTLGDDWDPVEVGKIAKEEIKEDGEEYIFYEDLVRLRLNFTEGRSAMAKAAKKYRKPERFEELKKELEKM